QRAGVVRARRERAHVLEPDDGAMGPSRLPRAVPALSGEVGPPAADGAVVEKRAGVGGAEGERARALDAVHGDGAYGVERASLGAHLPVAIEPPAAHGASLDDGAGVLGARRD